MKLAGKVTKANGDTEAKKSKAKKRPSTTAEEDETQGLNVPGKDEGLHLQGAMRRRLDWTPPRETALGDVIAAKGEEDIKSCDGTMDGFGKILSDYSFTRTASESQTLLNGDGAGLTKRRRIEVGQLFEPGVVNFLLFQACEFTLPTTAQQIRFQWRVICSRR